MHNYLRDTMKTVAQFLVLVLAGSGFFLFFNAKNDFKFSQLAQLENPLAEESKPSVDYQSVNRQVGYNNPLWFAGTTGGIHDIGRK